MTVTTALPEKVPGPVASLKAVKVYVVVEAGETLKVYGLLVIFDTFTGVVPSVYVKLHGCVPVKTTEMLVEAPAHIVLFPLMVAVCPNDAKATSNQHPAPSNSLLKLILLFKI